MRRVAITAAIVVALLSLAATARQTAARNSGIATVHGVARAADASSDALIHADATRALGYTGQGVTVAILDTGINHTNSDLAGSVIAEHCLVPPDGCPDGSAEQDGPGSAQDDEGHGTAMAAIIAGRGAVGPTGVAPAASLVVVKVADRNGRTTTPQILAGLNWVREHHPEVKVVNVSLGSDILLSGDCSGLTPTLIAFARTIDELRAQGTTVFASSGNRGQRYSMTSPACLHSVAAVGAVYSRSFGSFTAPNVCVDGKTAPDQVACFSDGGTELDLLAAGAPVDTLGLGDGVVSLLAGTSASSAQASGAAAALLQADPSLTPDALLLLLKSTGVPIRDPRNKFTTPRIDLAAALGAVLGHPVAVPPSPDAPTPVGPPVLSKPTVPKADLSIRPIAFGATGLLQAVTRRLVVRNAGTGYLTVRVATSLAAVSAEPAKLVIPASKRGTVLLTFRPERVGVYRGQIRLETDDPAAVRITVALRGTARS